jgi:long-chain acyl-CoA synthetase
MSLSQLLYRWSKERPSQTFLVGERSLTYAQAAEEVAKRAASLSPGQTVVHLMYNSVESVLTHLAVFWAGAKVISVDPLTSAEDLRFILEDSNPDLVVVDKEIEEREKEYLKGFKVVNKLPEKNVYEKPYEYRDDEVGLVWYYAGIAGRTMQVLHSAKRLELNGAALYKATGLKDVRSILTVPLAHVLGNSVLSVTLEAGGSMYVMRKFSVEEAETAINQYNINFLATVPMVYDSFIEKGTKPLDSLELCISTAAPLFPQTVEGFKKKYGKQIVQQYGFTEGLVVTFQPVKDGDVISVGRPLPGAEVKVIKQDGSEAKPGEVGELWVKAPWLMLGYKYKEETERVFKDGWLRTGDLMTYDERGLFYFRGVVKRMIKYKGYPILPRDLEEILKTHPLVEDVKVIGEDAGQLGQQPVALVKAKERRPGLENELLDYVNRRVAFYKRLKAVRLVDRIE